MDRTKDENIAIASEVTKETTTTSIVAEQWASVSSVARASSKQNPKATKREDIVLTPLCMSVERLQMWTIAAKYVPAKLPI